MTEKQWIFYIRMFTRAGAEPDPASRRAARLVAEVTEAALDVDVEAYDKLGLHADRITVSVGAAEDVCLAVFDRFLSEASGGWAILPFDEEVQLREAGWDARRTAEVLLDPSVSGAFLGVYLANPHPVDAPDDEES